MKRMAGSSHIITIQNHHTNHAKCTYCFKSGNHPVLGWNVLKTKLKKAANEGLKRHRKTVESFVQVAPCLGQYQLLVILTHISTICHLCLSLRKNLGASHCP